MDIFGGGIILTSVPPQKDDSDVLGAAGYCLEPLLVTHLLTSLSLCCVPLGSLHLISSKVSSSFLRHLSWYFGILGSSCWTHIHFYHQFFFLRTGIPSV